MPEWLRRSPDMVESPGLLEAPIDWASAALLERHHLPKRLAGPMTACVLTMNLDWIASLEPLEVEVTHPGGSYTLSRNFTVAVRGLDEYVTKDDWVRVWEAYVKPWQQEFWRGRGRRPQGRKTVDLNRLKRAMSLYVEMVQHGYGDKEMFEQAHLGSDQETIRRALRDLRVLLQPEK